MARFYKWLQNKELIKPYKGPRRLTESNEWSDIPTISLYEWLKGEKKQDVK